MDTTKENIKMVSCPEIQDGWIPQDGDHTWHPDEGAYIYGAWEFPARVAVVKITKQEPCEWWANWFWLPHQDQLQEMVRGLEKFDTSIQDITLACAFARFIGINNQDAEGRSNVFIRKGSMEQLWLAFVMKEKYHKVWDGNEWATSKVLII